MEQAGEGETAVWIRPAAAAARAATELSSFDQLTFVTSTSRGWAFSGRLDELALRQALQATVNDLPALAGRWVLQERCWERPSAACKASRLAAPAPPPPALPLLGHCSPERLVHVALGAGWAASLEAACA